MEIMEVLNMMDAMDVMDILKTDSMEFMAIADITYDHHGHQ